MNNELFAIFNPPVKFCSKKKLTSYSQLQALDDIYASCACQGYSHTPGSEFRTSYRFFFPPRVCGGIPKMVDATGRKHVQRGHVLFP